MSSPGGQWIGGPHRENATGGMEGATTAAVGKTFLLLAKAGVLTDTVLAEPIDDDCDDSTPKIPRRFAYEATHCLQSRCKLHKLSDPLHPFTL